MLSGSTTDLPRPTGGFARLLRAWAGAPRFLRNAAISLPTFLLDLGLLYVLVRRAHLDYLVATLTAFFAANGLGYFLQRWLVFVGTRRGLGAGLIYFLLIAAVSAVAVGGLMWLFVSVLHIELIVSRVAAAVSVGIGGYLLNLMLNFRVGGLSHPRTPLAESHGSSGFLSHGRNVPGRKPGVERPR